MEFQVNSGSSRPEEAYQEAAFVAYDFSPDAVVIAEGVSSFSAGFAVGVIKFPVFFALRDPDDPPGHAACLCFVI